MEHVKLNELNACSVTEWLWHRNPARGFQGSNLLCWKQRSAKKSVKFAATQNGQKGIPDAGVGVACHSAVSCETEQDSCRQWKALEPLLKATGSVLSAARCSWPVSGVLGTSPDACRQVGSCSNMHFRVNTTRTNCQALSRLARMGVNHEKQNITLLLACITSPS